MPELNQTGTIYIHTNQANGKCYVGQTWNYPRRTRGKAWDYRGNRHLSASFQKYGWDNFDHTIIVNNITSQDELDNAERLWTIVLRSTEREFGYNLMLGGERGGKHAKETIHRIRTTSKPNSGQFKKGQKPTRGYTGHSANSGSFKPGQFKGVKLSAEHRQKLSAGAFRRWERERMNAGA